MTKSEKAPILGISSPKTILMFRVGLKKLGYVGNRNHAYISFKPNIEIQSRITNNINKNHFKISNNEEQLYVQDMASLSR